MVQGFFVPWEPLTETFVLKAGEAISDVVRDPRDVVSPDKGIVFHRKEYKEPGEVHHTRGL